MKRFALVLLAALALVPVSAAADDTLARFKGGIGVIPVSSGAGTDTTSEVVTRNIVRGVQPAGQIWVIRDLRARIETDGSIKVDGRGLLLGGGNSIGFNANASVFATLICEVAPNSFVQHSTNPLGVPLEPNGDFVIDDVLSSPPATCARPVLLIRNAGNLAWFAAGIPKH